MRPLADPATPEGETLLRERLPSSRVAAVRSPLLVVQGRHDPRVPVAATDRFVAAARAAGADVAYLVFEDEGHGVARPANRVRLNAAIERFLLAALPAAPVRVPGTDSLR